jgi:hypothetical protein
VYFSGLFAFLTPRPKSEDDYLFLGVLAWLGGLSSSFAALHASWSTQSFTDFNGKLRFAERNAIGPILHLFMLAYPVDQEWRSERSFSAARALVHLLDERNLSVTDSWAHEALIQGAVEVASAAGLPGGAT